MQTMPMQTIPNYSSIPSRLKAGLSKPQVTPGISLLVAPAGIDRVSPVLTN
jgi:hypothetical protein